MNVLELINGTVYERSLTHRQDGLTSPMWQGSPKYRYDGTEWVDSTLDDGLVGMWDFQQQNLSGGTLRDVSGVGNDASVTGTSQVEGRVGDGLFIDSGGSGDRVTAPHSSELDVSDGPFTISLWFYRNSNFDGSVYTLFEKHATTDSRFDSKTFALMTSQSGTFSRSHENSAFFFRFDESDGTTHRTWVDSPTPFGAGPYYHVLCEADVNTDAGTTDVEVRINNEVRATASYNATPVSTTSDLHWATQWNSGSVFSNVNMGVCETRIYDRRLSETEKDYLYYLGGPVEDTLYFQFQNEPFTGNITDPAYFYDTAWTPPHRLIVQDVNNSNTDVYESSDPAGGSWTQIATDIGPGNGIADYIFDGTDYWLYAQAGGIWQAAGTGITSITQVGSLSGVSDIGVFYEGGTVYYFSEDDPVSGSPSGNAIGLYTGSSPSDENPTFQKDVIDLSDRKAATGDVDVELIDGTYWMVADHDTNAPRYGTLVAKAPAIDGPWRLVAETCKDGIGGDLEMQESEGILRGFTEFTGGDNDGIGYWEGEIKQR